jgi:peptide/nickel transport system substrate-binding protein
MSEQRTWEAELTRREFIGGVVVGAAAIALPGGLAHDAFAATNAKRGGTLRVGFVGGGTAETLDPHKSVAFIDAARAKNLFDKLTEFRPDMSVEYQLATSMTPNKDATVWQIKLRPGVVWHDGKPFTAADVIYSLARNLNPKNGLQALIDLAPIDLKRTKKVGTHEVLLALHQPIAEIPQLFAARTLSMIQNGATKFAHPIGTGPFKFVSFTPGTKSVFARNDHYWIHGKPYVDQLVMNSIPDNGARYNALVSGQIDAMENLDLSTAKTLVPSGFNIHADGVVVSTNKAVKLVNAPGSNMVAMCMLTNRPPFNDVRVRQAFRLAIDRPAAIEAAFVGFGQLGNDVYGKGLPDYDTGLPQRVADPARAKALLKQAGHAKLSVSIASSKAAPGMLESATVFASQAQAAGIDLTVDQSPADSYYSNKYLKVPFFQTQWGTQTIESQIVESLLKGAAFNETAWSRPAFDREFAVARGTLNKARRRTLFFDLQKEVWNQGGYLIWGFNNWVDAVSAKVRGVVPSPVFALGWYDFKSFWLA